MSTLLPLASDLPTTETALVALGLTFLVALLWIAAFFR